MKVSRKAQFLFFLVFLLSCFTSSKRIKAGGEIKIAWTGGLVGLDPAKDWGCAGAMKFIRLLFSPLYNADNPELGIASKVIHSYDYKEWSFYLRKDCYFHYDHCFSKNQRKVNSYDVKYSFERSKSMWHQLESFENIKEIIILDSFALKILLEKSDKDFINKLDKEYLYIVPFEAVERYGDNFGFHPVGSGPFCFQHWNKEELLMIKNKDFWAKDRWGQRLPYLDRIIVSFFADVNQCMSALFSKKVDLSPISSDATTEIFIKVEQEIVLKGEYADRFQVVQSPFPALTVLLCSCENNRIFRKSDLRKALNYAINREELKALFFMPRVQFANGPTLRNICHFSYEYNLKKAKEYLKRAGYPDGLRDLVFQYYPNPFSNELTLAIQRQLEVLNIKTKLSCASRPKTLRSANEWDMDIITIVYPDSTPETQLELYYSKCAPWVCFYSPIFDSLRELYKSTQAKDTTLLIRLDSLVCEDPPFVYLYWSYPLFLADKKLKELDPLFYVTCFTWWGYE